MSPPPLQNKAFELLALVAAFAQENDIELTDPTLVPRFMADAEPRLQAALADRSLLHGSRAERLFEATVLSLGRFRLFKTEDTGRVHAPKKYRSPDFRIVLEDGEQWLIEVKNVRRQTAFGQRMTMSAAYLDSIRTYADEVGVTLRLAVYWSLWNLWTVFDPRHFQRPGGGIQVKMRDALAVNEFSRLGDVMIATRAPLRLVLGVSTDKPRSLSEEGLAEFVIGSARVFSGDAELTDPRERRLAEILFLFGEWPVEGPSAVMDSEGFAGVEFVSAPEEPSGQGFDVIGSASRVFSSYFATQTVDGDRLIQLNGRPAPDWFAPLAEWDFKNGRLPLWLLRAEPNPDMLNAVITEPD